MKRSPANEDAICAATTEELVACRSAVACSPSFVDCSVCDWQQEEDGQWETDCLETFKFSEGGPKDNGFTWCPYCGKKLTETPCYDPENTEASRPVTTNLNEANQ